MFRFKEWRLALCQGGEDLRKNRTRGALEVTIDESRDWGRDRVDLYDKGPTVLGHDWKRGGGLDEGRRSYGQKDIG